MDNLLYSKNFILICLEFESDNSPFRNYFRDMARNVNNTADLLVHAYSTCVFIGMFPVPSPGIWMAHDLPYIPHPKDIKYRKK